MPNRPGGYTFVVCIRLLLVSLLIGGMGSGCSRQSAEFRKFVLATSLSPSDQWRAPSPGPSQRVCRGPCQHPDCGAAARPARGPAPCRPAVARGFRVPVRARRAAARAATSRPARPRGDRDVAQHGSLQIGHTRPPRSRVPVGLGDAGRGVGRGGPTRARRAGRGGTSAAWSRVT